MAGSAGFKAALVGLPCAEATADGSVVSSDATAAIVRTFLNIESSLRIELTEDHGFSARLRSDRVRESDAIQGRPWQGKSWAEHRASVT
jgi:hypothetical protein